eukprot:6091004-Pleurochrysis_carterae.AAC.1
MVHTPTQRKPLDTTTPSLVSVRHDELYSGLLHRMRMSPDPRLMRRRTPNRASKSGRAPKATAPSGVEAELRRYRHLLQRGRIG